MRSENVKAFFKISPIPNTLNGISLSELGVEITSTEEGYQFKFEDYVDEPSRRSIIQSFVVHSFAQHLTNSKTYSNVYEHVLCNEDVMEKLRE